MNNIMIGIYTITNIKNKKVYVGSTTTSFDQRFKEHQRKLNLGKHSNYRLQKDWNKYGKSSFKFEILEIVESDICFAIEQYWINTINPNYNLLRVVGNGTRGYKHTKKSKINMSISSGGKPFEVWKDNTLIKIYNTQNECCEELGLLQSKISKCLNGIFKQTKGYSFRYLNEDFKYKRKKGCVRNRKPHSDLTKIKISKSNLNKKRSKTTKEKLSKIFKQQFKDGRIPFCRKFSYEDRLKLSKLTTKGIIVIYNKDMKKIEQFNSIMELCLKYNFKKQSVHAVLSGKRTSLFGYIIKRQ